MIDKSHCFMNTEDEREYSDFYDFTKLYKADSLPLKENSE